MNITLRPLNEDNWQECIKLKVSKKQEDFVSSNVYSIAQTRFEPTWEPLVIYDYDTMVGFIMYDSADYEVVRFMIDQGFQGRGYGKAAMQLLLAHFEREYAHPTSTISFVPGNTAAEGLYRHLGYHRTGEMSDGEIVMLRVLRSRKK